MDERGEGVSWLVHAKGHAAAVRAQIVQQFEAAKQGKLAPHERRTLQHCQSGLMAQLDWVIERRITKDVQVDAASSVFDPREEGEGGTSWTCVFQMITRP